jgi:ubiquinone/menaquinone biosynthesis C-methylase UbiE
MAILDRWRATGEDVYREVARVADLSAGQDVLVAGCGRGVTTEWLAARTGAEITGVDPDPDDIQRAEERIPTSSTPLLLTYQHAQLDDLPYETNVFDVSIGEPEIAAAASPDQAVSELARVTKPMGSVVLLQVTWRSELPPAVNQKIVERLGLRPRLLVEWKQVLRDAGVVDIQVDDWTDACDDQVTCEQVEEHLPERVQDALRQDASRGVSQAFRRSGWKEARQTMVRETEFWRELLRERSLGFSMLKGVKWPHAQADVK